MINSRFLINYFLNVPFFRFISSVTYDSRKEDSGAWVGSPGSSRGVISISKLFLSMYLHVDRNSNERMGKSILSKNIWSVLVSDTKNLLYQASCFHTLYGIGRGCICS
jgi:hypothetical protein